MTNTRHENPDTLRVNAASWAHRMWAPISVRSAIVFLAVSMVFVANANAPEHVRAYAAEIGVNPPDSRIPGDGEPLFGGTLHVAESRGIASLDNIRVPNNTVESVYLHVAEGLFATDLTGSVVPQLVDSYTVNQDATVFSFTLRRGVPFHNGEELTARDAVASFNRWLTGGTGREVAPMLVSAVAEGEHEMVVTLNEPFAFFPMLLTVGQTASLYILPADQVEAAGDGDVGIPIGTGPYKVEEFNDAQWVRLVRFDDYAGLQTEPSGFAGGKAAYLDEIVMHFVLDETVRVFGVQSGQYHFSMELNPDLYDQFADSPQFRTRIATSGFIASNLNKRQGPMADQRIRQAFALAIDVRPIAEAVGIEEFHWLDSSWLPRDTPWHTSVGLDAYLAHDPDRARELLAEANYDGAVIRWLVNPEIPAHYVPGLIARPMLEAVGFNVELRPMDHATIRTTRADPALWEVYQAGVGARAEPTSVTFFQPDYVGWFDAPVKNDLIAAMRDHTEFDERFAIWEELHEFLYEYVPLVPLFHYATFHLESSAYSGAFIADGKTTFTNTWLNR